MKQALLQMVMQNNAAIMAGGTPDLSAGLGLLQAMQSGQLGGGGPGSGSAVAGAPGASGGLPQAPKGSVVQAAREMLGTPYVWGGNSPSQGLDCSAFVQQVYAQLGVKLPRTTYDQVKHGAAVPLSSSAPATPSSRSRAKLGRTTLASTSATG
jgi:cell wall-associated NlpC family hydrolase